MTNRVNTTTKTKFATYPVRGVGQVGPKPIMSNKVGQMAALKRAVKVPLK